MESAISKSKGPKSITLLVIWGLVSLYAGIYGAAYVWLFQRYGFSRVLSEHLHFVSMPKAGSWTVSNGDQITTGFFVHYFLVALALWFAIFLTPLFLIFKRKERYAA